MKSPDLAPIEVLEAERLRLERIIAATGDAQQALSAWEATSEAAAKASLSPTSPGVKAIGEMAIEALGDLQKALLDATSWLDAWAGNGKARIAAFLRLAARGFADPDELSLIHI